MENIKINKADYEPAFEIESKELFAVKKSGYKLDPKATTETAQELEERLTPNELDKKIDGFKDLDCAYLCTGKDGKKYAVEFNADQPEIWHRLIAAVQPIKEAREKAGLTQAQLAEAAGSSIRTIQDWESGRRIPRDVYVLRDMARALGCRIEDLIE